MSPYLEFEGKTLEKALTKACDELNISKEQLKHDVISYGSTGIFGLVGAKKARIRVRAPEPPPWPRGWRRRSVRRWESRSPTSRSSAPSSS